MLRPRADVPIRISPSILVGWSPGSNPPDVSVNPVFILPAAAEKAASHLRYSAGPGLCLPFGVQGLEGVYKDRVCSSRGDTWHLGDQSVVGIWY